MPFILYISVSDISIWSLLAQNNNKWQQQAIYYLSRGISPVEQYYLAIEKLYLSLYFTSQKHRAYLLPTNVMVVCKTNLVKYLLTRPILHGWLGKWALAMMEFSLSYVPAKTIKGQALADFEADHPSVKLDPTNMIVAKSLFKYSRVN